jgi:hypothetical protein
MADPAWLEKRKEAHPQRKWYRAFPKKPGKALIVHIETNDDEGAWLATVFDDRGKVLYVNDWGYEQTSQLAAKMALADYLEGLGG